MEVIRGKMIFSGIAIGKIRYYYENEKDEEHILDIHSELSLLHQAEEQVFQNLLTLRVMEEAEIEALALLKSGSYLKALDEMILQERVRAVNAVNVTRNEMVQTFGSLESPAIRSKLTAIGMISDKLQVILMEKYRKKKLLKEPSIVVSESLTPADVMKLEKNFFLGVIVESGTALSPASIVVHEMDVPMMVCEVDTEWDGKDAILDGYTGTMYLQPDAETLKEYRLRKQQLDLEKLSLLKLKDEKDLTLDGRLIPVCANVGNLQDLKNVDHYGGAGIGLVRTEFQYIGRTEYPGEEELYQQYRGIAEAMGDRPCVIRTMDLGGDRKSPYMNIPEEENPMMGNRGIRFSLDHREILKNQMRALFRAGIHGNVKILYPMITSVSELRTLAEIEEEVREELRRRRVPFAERMERGAMVETPAAVLISRELAREVDFLSIGTNDLTQYVLAMDRQNAGLRSKYEEYHPAVFRMIQIVIDEAHAENCSVTICGELASDICLTEKFLRMGVDCLSVVPAMILPVRNIIRETDLSLDPEFL